MKTREEEIREAAWDRTNYPDCENYCTQRLSTIFEAGAQWADEHPKNPWRDAKKDPPRDGEWFVAITDLMNGLKVPVVGRIGIDIFIQAFKRRYQYWMPIQPLQEGGEK